MPRNSGVLNIIDASAMTLTKSLATDPLPMTIRIARDNATAWVASLATGRVTVVDLNGGRDPAYLNNNVGGAYGGTHGMIVAPK